MHMRFTWFMFPSFDHIRSVASFWNGCITFTALRKCSWFQSTIWFMHTLPFPYLSLLCLHTCNMFCCDSIMCLNFIVHLVPQFDPMAYATGTLQITNVTLWLQGHSEERPSLKVNHTCSCFCCCSWSWFCCCCCCFSFVCLFVFGWVVIALFWVVVFFSSFFFFFFLSFFCFVVKPN